MSVTSAAFRADLANALVPVFRTKFAKGWPEHQEGERAEYLTVGQAMMNRFSSDAHFTAYSVPSVARRLATDAVFAEIESAPIVLFVIDVDATVTPAWWASERIKIDRMFAEHPGGFVYRTRGGYRIVYRLAEPVRLTCSLDAERWKAQYVAWLGFVEARYGIVGDDACKDWTRLYRLPFVTRDGERQELETIGDADAIGVWDVVVDIPEPEPRRVKSPTGVYSPKPGDFDIDAFMSSHYPGVGCRNVSDGRRWDIECPWHHEHSSSSGKRETSVFANAMYDDRPGFKCQHEHCLGRRWQEFRAWHDPTYTPFVERTSLSSSHERQVSDTPGSVSETLAPAGAKVHTADPFAAEISTALVDVKAKLDAATSERKPLFQTDAVELLGRQFDGARWLVTGLITRGGITMIGAEPKAAKTWLGTEIAVAIATGSKVCGEFFAEFGRVAYFYAEDMDYQVRNRVRALLAGADRRLLGGRLFLQPRGTFIDILDDNNLAWLVASCRRLGVIDLLVLDPLRDIHDGEEDKSDSMRNVMRRLRVLAELLGCTVAVVHHAPKANKENAKRRPGQNLRGSGAIHGSVDSGLYLEDSDGDGTNVFTNTVTSQVKGAKSAGRFAIELTVTDNDQGEATDARWTFARAVPGKTAKTQQAAPGSADDLIVAAWVRELDEPLSKTALREHDGRPVGDQRMYRALTRLIETGILQLHGGLVHHSSRAAVGI